MELVLRLRWLVGRRVHCRRSQHPQADMTQLRETMVVRAGRGRGRGRGQASMLLVPLRESGLRLWETRVGRGKAVAWMALTLSPLKSPWTNCLEADRRGEAAQERRSDSNTSTCFVSLVGGWTWLTYLASHLHQCFSDFMALPLQFILFLNYICICV